MRTFAAMLMMIGLAAGALEAQGRGRYDARSQGIPPGQMPPPGACRVWYDNVPPGRQPAPTSCANAERVAARSRNARVIYGGNAGWNTPRAFPRAPADVRRSPGQYGRRGGQSGAASVPFGNGYEDGFNEGRDDARDRDRFEPERHGRFRSADRGYNDRFGWSREQYREVYREGFIAGYEDGFRNAGGITRW